MEFILTVRVNNFLNLSYSAKQETLRKFCVVIYLEYQETMSRNYQLWELYNQALVSSIRIRDFFVEC